jgi:uncharacterized protein YdgA (DUF945 family)
MKKLWIALTLVFLLAVAWLGLAWHTGKRLETETSALIARLNDAWSKSPATAQMRPQVKQISYQRGLLTSHARYAVTGSLLKSDEPLAEFDLSISHGPFPLTALQRGQLAPRQFDAHAELLATGPLKAMAGALMNGKPPLVMDFACSYGKHCTGNGNVPPIDFDFGPFAKNAKLAFGGVEMRLDIEVQAETDYKSNADVRLLPLSIAGQDFGSGQITASGDAQSGREVISWKTDQGESKITLALAANQPMPLWGDAAMTPETLLQLIKNITVKAELSKAMLIDIAAKVISLTGGVDLAAAQQEAQAQFDAMLTSSPDLKNLIRAEDKLLVSDWQYADGKLSINGQERPEILEQIKQSYLTGVHSGGNAVNAPEPESEPESAPNEEAGSGESKE